MPEAAPKLRLEAPNEPAGPASIRQGLLTRNPLTCPTKRAWVLSRKSLQLLRFWRVKGRPGSGGRGRFRGAFLATSYNQRSVISRGRERRFCGNFLTGRKRPVGHALADGPRLLSSRRISLADVL